MDVVGSDSSGNNDIDDFSDGRKMTRAEFIMAQVDLDPIESHGSQELSTTNFKQLNTRKFLEAKSSFASSGKPPTGSQSSKKSYESKYTLLDLS